MSWSHCLIILPVVSFSHRAGLFLCNLFKLNYCRTAHFVRKRTDRIETLCWIFSVLLRRRVSSDALTGQQMTQEAVCVSYSVFWMCLDFLCVCTRVSKEKMFGIVSHFYVRTLIYTNLHISYSVSFCKGCG